ncbi:MAG: cytochrome P450 [Deltaproteobacteria bacterium]|nr:cytochrome P450 [Deltaproteobacteria bacterium]
MQFNPFSDEFFNDPYETYRQLRDEAPVYHNEEWGFYALSRFEDVVEAHIDHRTYSSARGVLIQDMDPAMLEAVPMMILMDPPKQTRLRKLLSSRFTPRKVQAMEPVLRELAASILEPLRERDSFDFVKDYSSVYPMDFISQLMGVPVEDRLPIRNLVDASLTRRADTPDIPPSAIHAMGEMTQYFRDFIAERRRNPKEDLISELMSAEVTRDDGKRDRLTDAELLGFASLLAAAGAETTTKLMSNTLVLTWRHPEVHKRVVEDPAAIAGTIEESLRYWPPSQIQGRSATREVELHGVTIPEGSRVLLLTGAACRDERQYHDPDRFDIDREISLQIALGHGTHKCLGSFLARLETRVSFEEFFKRFPSFEVHEEACERVHMSNVAGYSAVPLSVTGG